jgi:hypothetical protein
MLPNEFEKIAAPVLDPATHPDTRPFVEQAVLRSVSQEFIRSFADPALFIEPVSKRQ